VSDETFHTNVMMAKLGVHFGMPDKDTRHARKIITEYARLMVNYSDNELSEAADIVLRRHRFRTWPSIAECIKALEDYRASVHEKTAPEMDRRLNAYPEWSKERIEKADHLIKCDLGRKAAQEGWIHGLHDFCRNHDRLPKDHEIQKIMQSARFIDRFMAGETDRCDLDLPPNSDGEISLQMNRATMGMLRTLGNSLLAKREKLREEVLG
jgi:hypothetical protein